VDAKNGKEALKRKEEEHFDLIVLDVMLPEIDGFEVCSKIRLTDRETPILFLTAKDAAENRISGLKRGGDDYLTKPFVLEELLLRIKNLIKRSQPEKSQQFDEFSFGDNIVNFKTYEAESPKGKFALTQKEVMLLKMLIDRKNEVVSRKQILQHVWGYDVYPSTRTIDNFILNFRKYFEKDPKSPEFFKSVRGVGYKMSL
jgi:two-component system alkaline phosphatase synthesis response regulator PhoP